LAKVPHIVQGSRPLWSPAASDR